MVFVHSSADGHLDIMYNASGNMRVQGFLCVLCGHVFISLGQLPRSGTDCSDPSGSEAVSCYGLNLHFPGGYGVEQIFQYAVKFIGSLYTFFGKLFIQILCPFIKWVIEIFFF